ncbi:hypothetical protein [Pedobacter sp. SYSU D00535]|uniref:hypothetical protein n=1 Tax=Pedobacter sp. SYSU D00535 TaxID=2810308 RepID=UPI001A96C2CA|nr:hypothetical protein [Pedobacter sp. SYSU D00535]
MNRPISRKAHGVAELIYPVLTALAPELLKFKDDKKATTLARAMAGGMAGSALLTRSEWGAVKVVPFKAHLAADVGFGLFSIAAPWLFKIARNTSARNAFLFVGISSLLIGGLLTERKEM